MSENEHRPIQVGDVVQIASGGPKMTVQELDAGGNKAWTDCVWFVGTELNLDSFVAATLRKVE